MTGSNGTGRAATLLARPPDNPPPGPEWKPIPGAGYYEASHRGAVRSVNRTVHGRFLRGVVLKTRLNNSGYEQVNIVNDAGEKVTVTVHSAVLLAHAGYPPAGQETLHGPGGQRDNRWPENIRYGTHEVNVAERVAANPRAPRPQRECVNHVRCGGYVTTGGKRCHECVVAIGQGAAALIEDGMDLDKAAEAVGYPSVSGVYRLAVKYGGLRHYLDDSGGLGSAVDPVAARDAAAGHTPEPGFWSHGVTPRWLRSVRARWLAWLGDGDTE